MICDTVSSGHTILFKKNLKFFKNASIMLYISKTQIRKGAENSCDSFVLLLNVLPMLTFSAFSFSVGLLSFSILPSVPPNRLLPCRPQSFLRLWPSRDLSQDTPFGFQLSTLPQACAGPSKMATRLRTPLCSRGWLTALCWTPTSFGWVRLRVPRYVGLVFPCLLRNC